VGSVFKKQITRTLPQGSEIFVRKGQRFAKWRDGRGRSHTAPLTIGRGGSERIREESSRFYARYKDGGGLWVETTTGCRDLGAAQQVLADLERRAERVRSGLLTSAEDRIAEHLASPLGEQFDAYLASLESAGVVPLHRHNVRVYLSRIAADCRLVRLGDLRREALER
jgi:hypothetical protein